jgi:hypothetical protein
MKGFDELMQRLCEIQRNGKQRSPQLIAEDRRWMDALLKRNAARKPIDGEVSASDESGFLRPSDGDTNVSPPCN